MARISSVCCELHCICGVKKSMSAKIPQGTHSSQVSKIAQALASHMHWEMHPDRTYDLCPRCVRRPTSARL